MLHLDYGDHRPLYEQIKEKLKELIIGGILQEHDKIPSVRELAANLAINPNTIQKAYKDLENEGYIYSQKAKGSFVSPRENATDTIDIYAIEEALVSSAKELKFLGKSKEDIISIIEKVYKED